MFAPFVKFNMAAVNSWSLLKGWIFILMGAFQRKRRRERQRAHNFWVREIFQKREFRYFAVGNAVHPGIVAVATIAVIAEIELKSISRLVSIWSLGFFYLWVFFNVEGWDGKDKEPIDFGFERSSRRGNFGILLSGTQCILTFLLSLRSLWSLRSLESGFPIIAAIATNTEKELKSISAIVVAVITTIAGEWFPYDRYERGTFFHRS